MDWDAQNRIPPWMSNIQPGSTQGVLDKHIWKHVKATFSPVFLTSFLFIDHLGNLKSSKTAENFKICRESHVFLFFCSSFFETRRGCGAGPISETRWEAKDLLKDGKVSRIIVTGGDPAGVGRTEAFEMRKVLVNAGIPQAAWANVKIWRLKDGSRS